MSTANTSTPTVKYDYFKCTGRDIHEATLAITFDFSPDVPVEVQRCLREIAENLTHINGTPPIDIEKSTHWYTCQARHYTSNFTRAINSYTEYLQTIDPHIATLTLTPIIEDEEFNVDQYLMNSQFELVFSVTITFKPTEESA
ncbi:hypothetical protein MGYG_08575 [Nannizzia gypsea CBS 118893]|uniref:Uncharacterized protein n=1 Tax=Arthroderma gypseum (strain ATCC MYA-4604 / CBS 118893) TaxID=535722 RepID=E4V634_ARTGP|nr:hypothetical protein MGYG_08575 [Nannizzia gypsea CBS 118893]EFR05559.1 hypothetical protein MGYG_08575 [Nannizzia gypsea CBS 118893]